MRKGGTLFTMSYYGSQMVVKNYNIMGVAKAALECAVRYIAAELGPKGIRVHAISPGPLATRAASGIPEFDALLDKLRRHHRRDLALEPLLAFLQIGGRHAGRTLPDRVLEIRRVELDFGQVEKA